MTTTVKIIIVALAILAIWFGVMWYRNSKTPKPAKTSAPATKPDDVFVQLTDLFSTGNSLADSTIF